MRCAAEMLALELAVALPYGSAVFTGRMPNLRTVKAAAVSADLQAAADAGGL